MDNLKVNLELISKKYSEAFAGLNKEISSLKNRTLAEQKNAEMLDSAKIEIVEKIRKAREEKWAVEGLIQQEELKLKKCSDETKKRVDQTRQDIQSTVLAFKEKNAISRDKLGVELKLFKEQRVLKCVLLKSGQEVSVSLGEGRGDTRMNAYYTECVVGVDNPDAKRLLDSTINEFNSAPVQNLKDLVLWLRDIFECD